MDKLHKLLRLVLQVSKPNLIVALRVVILFFLVQLLKQLA